MSDVAIRVEGLSKQYHIGGKQERYKTLRDSLADAFAAPFRRAGKLLRGQAAGAAELDETIWALKDVSFEVKRGEVIGIIGRNGAGKTTLLKILSRITEPTEGHAEVHGRVGSLLEVGTGFHPELTGRENIFLNGAILGMKRQEIERKFDEIVAFAEMEKFIDTPVKHYSSGMYVRLAFAVAAHLEPEILLVDEVLSVGDIAFRKKSMGKMSNVAEEGGRTILFVSHDMASISALCHRSIYLTQGRIEAIGLTNEIVRQYMIASGSGERQVPLAQRADRRGDGRVRVTGLRVLDSMSRRPIQCIISGHDVCVEVSYKAQDPSITRLERFNISLVFFTAFGQFVMVLNSQMASGEFEYLPPEGRVHCHVPRFPLMDGDFFIKVTLQVGGRMADQVENALKISVEPGDFYGTGVHHSGGRQGVYVNQSWSNEIE